MKKHIPNAITSLNLFSGCVGAVFALQGRLDIAAYLVILSGVFDFFDGMVARLLNVHSDIGKQLDSLADVVSFGFLPGAIMFKLLQEASPDQAYLPYAGFIVTVFSAIRLAKFNIDSRQSVDFIGLNTPMNAFYVISLPFIAERFPGLVFNTVFLLASILLTSYLLVSELRLFSMKLYSFSWQENQYKFIFIILSVVLICLLKFAAIPIILVLYILFSFIHFKKTT